MTRKIIATSFTLLLLPLLAGAAVLASWNNQSLAGNEASAPANFFDAGLLSGAPTLARGPGLSASAYQNTFGFGGRDASSLANAISNSDYIDWTVTPVSSVSIASIFFRTRAVNSAAEMALFYSLDGFSTAPVLGDVLKQWTSPASPNDKHSETVSLAGVGALQNIGSTITFRLYAYGGGQYDQMGIGWGFDSNNDNDLIINGVDAVPEPTSLALILFTSVIFLVRKMSYEIV